MVSFLSFSLGGDWRKIPCFFLGLPCFYTLNLAL
jgi:hypothetical protein